MFSIGVLSEQRESGGSVNVFTFKFLLAHSEHQYTLDYPYDRGYSAQHKTYDQGDDACGVLSEIEILDTESSQEYSKQCGYSAALS